MIRYRTTPEAADENQRLIEDVFAELAAKTPDGLQYTSVRLADGVSFLHLVIGEGLTELPAFREFQRDFGRRVVAAPERTDVTVVGTYTGSFGATGSSQTEAAPEQKVL
ncbi:hypothetical protein GCM10009744_49000 [Kribbella alba]|uniref:Uncharacterized protein n=2 Tax=Kribbella alba TaxID=190197 RepID=A0ABN2FM00_9ACTN